MFDHFARSSWRQNRLLILGYHGVSLDDEHLWDPELFMPPEVLRRRFELIKKLRCTVLSLSDGISHLYAGTLPARAVVITFDDGLYNFYKQALPILREFKFPATVYLTTFYTLNNKPVFDVAVGYALWKAGMRDVKLKRLFDKNLGLDVNVPADPVCAREAIVRYAETAKLSADEKNEVLARLYTELDMDFEAFCRSRMLQLMNSGEIEEVSRSEVDVQLHTHRHRVPMDQQLFDREIDDNRRVIERITGNRPTHFCYPSGVHNSKYFPWLENADVTSATTCDAALSDRGTNRYLLPRLVDTSLLSEVEFEGWVVGASHFLPQRFGLINL